MADYDELIEDAEKWKVELGKKVANTEIDPFYIDYEAVARSFPSKNNRPETFEFNFINEQEFRKWANNLGYDVDQDQSEIGKYDIPRIKFKKK